MTEFGAVDYKTRQAFHGVIWASRPAEDNPAVSVITGKLLTPLPEVMSDFARWLEDLGKERPIFISDNPAYDYQWINAAFDSCGMENPFGHSARRIGDFWAGLRRDCPPRALRRLTQRRKGVLHAGAADALLLEASDDLRPGGAVGE